MFQRCRSDSGLNAESVGLLLPTADSARPAIAPLLERGMIR